VSDVVQGGRRSRVSVCGGGEKAQADVVGGPVAVRVAHLWFQ
jgi:hypothetical protein